MKRWMNSMAGLAAVLFTVPASATVSVNLVAASGSFTPGATVSLQTFVTVTDFPFVNDNVFGAINYADALVDPYPAGTSQVALRGLVPGPSPGHGLDWFTSSLLCTSAFCQAFNQLNPAGVGGMDLTNFQISTTTFIIDPGAPVGTIINFSWRTTPTIQGLDFFGVTNAPGVSITVIPEPTTAVLVAIGLLGLAAAGRRPRATRCKGREGVDSREIRRLEKMWIGP